MFSYQMKAFLNQRLVELKNDETLSLRNQVHTVAPLVLQQYTPDAIKKMLSDVSLAISLLTNKKTRDLIMIFNSKRYCFKQFFFFSIIFCFVVDLLVCVCARARVRVCLYIYAK